MAEQPNDFRERLFDAQQFTPELRQAYRDELDQLTHETHTPKSRIGGAIFLIICLGVVIGEIRALIVYRDHGPTFFIGAITMLIVCAVAAVWIIRDFLRGKSVRRHQMKVSEMFYTAAGILTVVTLMHGLSKASDPASTFNAFYVYVFFATCATWGLSNRIGSATLETREHLLRLESRLADLSERLPKG